MAESHALIVEHDEAVLAGLRRALDGQTVALAAAPDATAAIARLGAGHRLRGIIVDLDSSGADVLRHIARACPELPVVVMARSPSPELLETLDARQVRLVLRKPVDDRLLATVVLGLCAISPRR